MKPILVVDTESSGLYADDGARISAVSWACRDGKGRLVAKAIPLGQGVDRLTVPVDEWESFLTWIGGFRLVFHNAAHDLPMLAAGTMSGYPGVDFVDAFYWDTMIAQRHLDPLSLVGLEASCLRLKLVDEPWKDRLKPHLKKTKKRFDLLDWEVIEPYATEDAINTLLLFEDQRRRLIAYEGSPEILGREMQLAKVLYKMEQRGIGFDATTCEVETAKLETQLQDAVQKLPIEMLSAKNSPTPMRICKYYYDQLGYKPTKWDASKREHVRSADEYSRRGLADQGAPFIAELNAWSTLETALTSWYRPYAANTGPDGRLRARMRQTKVSSGRLSAERANLLAIPHDTAMPPGLRTIRSMFAAKPGAQLWEVDLSQAEVRVGVVDAQCRPLIEAYQKGYDVYALTAKQVFFINPEDDDFTLYRNLCKRIVLSSLYAAGAKTLVRTCKQFMGIDLEEEKAQAFLETFRRTYPEFKRRERLWARYVDEHGYVPVALNERRYFQSYEQSYKGFNQRIQSSVAVGMKVAMLKVEEQHPGILLLQTHDSLLLETADQNIVDSVAGIMENTFQEIFSLPFTTEVKQWQ